MIWQALFLLVIRKLSQLNDKICSHPLCRFFKCKSNIISLDIMCFPLRMIECLKSNGSSAWRIGSPTLIMFSCNSDCKDKILLFHDTVCVVLSEDSIFVNLQIVLRPSSKSFGNKYEKYVVLFMQRFFLPSLF